MPCTVYLYFTGLVLRCGLRTEDSNGIFTEVWNNVKVNRKDRHSLLQEGDSAVTNFLRRLFSQYCDWKRFELDAMSICRAGNHDRALCSLARKAIDMAEKHPGSAPPEVATSLSTLADLLRAQGQYAEAEGLYKHALAIDEKALGSDNPDVGVDLNNLAVLYEAQGRYALAESLHIRSLAIKEKALGYGHPEVAASLSNLAMVYLSQGEYAQAQPLLTRLLAIYEKAFGPDHPDVALSLSNLGGLYDAQGQYEQAEALFKRSLAIHVKTLGTNHPEVRGASITWLVCTKSMAGTRKPSNFIGAHWQSENPWPRSSGCGPEPEQSG